MKPVNLTLKLLIKYQEGSPRSANVKSDTKSKSGAHESQKKPCLPQENGASGRTRTCNLLIRRQESTRKPEQNSGFAGFFEPTGVYRHRPA
jgi:hypothetical protein